MLCLFAQRKMLQFVSSRWRADPVTFFDKSKLHSMQIYFIANEKLLASAGIEPGFPQEKNYQLKALPLS